MELGRVASHLVWWGTFLLDLGATSPFLYAFRDREMMINLLNEISGGRLTFNYMRVGGVKWDAPDGWIEKVKEFIPYMREQIQGYHQLVTGNEIFLESCEGCRNLYKRGSPSIFIKWIKLTLYRCEMGFT